MLTYMITVVAYMITVEEYLQETLGRDITLSSLGVDQTLTIGDSEHSFVIQSAQSAEIKDWPETRLALFLVEQELHFSGWSFVDQIVQDGINTVFMFRNERDAVMARLLVAEQS